MFPLIFAAVVLNEIYPKPADEAGEWVELYNTDSQQVSLDRWSLQNGAGQNFLMNASFIIQGHGFLTLPRSQTGITLKDEGDTVKLLNEKGELADSKDYPSTLGFNTSVGRSGDGSALWNVCNTPATPNSPNNCPVPTPTNTPIPTTTPLPTLTPIAQTPVPPAAQPQVASVLPVSEEITVAPTPTPTISPDVIVLSVPKTIMIPKMAALQVAIVAVFWAVLITIAVVRNKKRRPHP